MLFNHNLTPFDQLKKNISRFEISYIFAETYFMVWQEKIMDPITNCMGAIRVRISCYLERRKRIEEARSTTRWRRPKVSRYINIRRAKNFEYTFTTCYGGSFLHFQSGIRRKVFSLNFFLEWDKAIAKSISWFDRNNRTLAYNVHIVW